MLTDDFLHTVAQGPGVYLMKDSEGAVLYVGKAKNLRKRLASYRRPETDSKTHLLMKRMVRVATILTGTEKEALILEASLIKKYRPRYNIDLRDDKSYPYVKVTVNEKWPRIVVTRQHKKDGARYFGPYAASSAMRATLALLQKLFPLRSCKETHLRQRPRPCLDYQIHRCPAPCAGKVTEQRYAADVANVLRVLEGKGAAVLAMCHEQMNEAAQRLAFEEAAQWRDRIQAFESTMERQVVVNSRGRDQDIFGIAQDGGGKVFTVLMVRKGVVSGSLSFEVAGDVVAESAQALREAVVTFYAPERFLPDEILLPDSIEDAEVVQEWLSERRGGKTVIRSRCRGEGRRLLAMAAANAAQRLQEVRAAADRWETIKGALHTALRLHAPPSWVECLDISTFHGDQSVASLVAFVEGRPEKKKWRHYRMEGMGGQDDFAMMAEAAGRRFTKEPLPDLLLVDGGKGQLSMVARVVRQLGLADRISLAAIAKGKGDEVDTVYIPGRKNPVRLARHDPTLLFLMRLRDEAHRFGVTFHRKWRRKQTLASGLDAIAGVGPDRKKKLLQQLGSETRIKNASLAMLQAVEGIGPELAKTVFAFYHPAED